MMNVMPMPSYVPHHCGAWPCPICHPNVHRQMGGFPLPYYPVTVLPSAPVGCVCPPTSENTCRNDNCPRRSTSEKWAAANRGLNLSPHKETPV